MDDTALAQAIAWLAEGKSVALAMVVSTWGSSPRPPGSLLAIDADGAFAGSVSGGCIEGAVIAEAREVISSGVPRRLEYGVSDQQAWAAGLACGGSMSVHVMKVIRPDFLEALRTRRPIAFVTHLESGVHTLVGAGDVDGDLALSDETVATARRALDDDRCILVDDGIFVRVFNPPLRMIVVGAVHIAQSLAPMAALAGFAVTVVDPRRAFATAERFPGVTLRHDWPDEALEALAPDARSAVVTLVHDPKLDDPALEAALNSPAYYIGALGSRKAHGERLRRLAAHGFSEAALDRIHGPVGLDLGGRGPAEIAVSILAQAVARRYRRDP
jgi:xanthine dehydrogenase accessory factor